MGENDLPGTFKSVSEKYPEIWAAHEQLTKACADAGPLDRRSIELIKIGICIGAGLETATKRHAIMARENGASDDEIYQAVLMAVTTVGYPSSAAGWKWVNSVLEK